MQRAVQMRCTSHLKYPDRALSVHIHKLFRAVHQSQYQAVMLQVNAVHYRQSYLSPLLLGRDILQAS